MCIRDSINDSQDTDNLDFLAAGITLSKLLNVAIPPSLDIDLELITDEVFGALCTTFKPVSRFCPCPAKEIPVYSILEFAPFKTDIGYNIETFEPRCV